MLAALWSDLLAPRADWRWSAFRVARVIGDRGPSSTDRVAQIIGNWMEPSLPTVWDVKVILDLARLHLSSRAGGPTIGTIGRWGSAHQVRIFSHNRQYACCSCVLTPSGFDEIRVGRTVKRRSLGRFLAMQEFKLTTLLILFLSLSNSQCESLQRNSVI